MSPRSWAADPFTDFLMWAADRRRAGRFRRPEARASDGGGPTSSVRSSPRSSCRGWSARISKATARSCGRFEATADVRRQGVLRPRATRAARSPTSIGHHLWVIGLLVWATSMFAAYATFGHRRPLNAVVLIGAALVINMALTTNDQLGLPGAVQRRRDVPADPVPRPRRAGRVAATAYRRPDGHLRDLPAGRLRLHRAGGRRDRYSLTTAASSDAARRRLGRRQRQRRRGLALARQVPARRCEHPQPR